MNTCESDSIAGCEVLVVEDTLANLQLLTEILSRAGYNVRSAGDGELALRSVNAKLPDIILLDIMMPGMDGFEVCRVLKSNDDTRSVPIIFISALEDVHSKKKGFEIGAVDYISKPFHAEEVLARVKTHLTISRLQVNIERQNERLLKEIAERNHAEQTLERLNAELELRIQRRTAQLAESQAQIRCAFDLSPIGNALVGINGRILKVNTALCNILGYTEDELLSKTIQDISDPGDLASDIDNQRQLLAGTIATCQIQKRCRRAQGRLICIQQNCFLVRDSNNEPSYFIFQIQDITDRKQTEQTLLSANHYNRSLIEASPDPLVTIGSDGKITDVNLAAEVATGCRREELIGTDFANYFTDPERARAGYRHVFQEGHIHNYELNIRCRDGSEIPVLYNASVYRNTNGQVIGVFAAARDISERKQAEQTRLDLELKLQQLKKAESLGRMAGAIAHHFNNQLYVIMGNLEMAMDDMSQDSDTFRSMAEAMKAADKVAQISSLMLTYLGQTPGKQEPLDLSDICRQSLPLLQASLPKQILFHADLPATGPFIRTNVGQIQKILANLVANAFEAAGENPGTIDLRVKTVALENIPNTNRFPVDWQPKESVYACLEVADTGCGIESGEIEKVFDPFFTTKFTGRGLGLSVVLGLVGAQGGGITVESHPGRGSIFRVFLPVSAEAAPVSLKKTESVPEMEETGTVLVVEDDPLVRHMIKTMLIHLGFSVLEAKDGVEAVAVFQQHQHEIRCVLSDLTMPRMDGWATLAALRKISPKIPVILSSGYDEALVMAEEHSERPDAFLGKPYQLKGLHETIDRVLANADDGI